jgi:hypothetical protein
MRAGGPAPPHGACPAVHGNGSAAWQGTRSSNLLSFHPDKQKSIQAWSAVNVLFGLLSLHGRSTLGNPEADWPHPTNPGACTPLLITSSCGHVLWSRTHLQRRQLRGGQVSRVHLEWQQPAGACTLHVVVHAVVRARVERCHVAHHVDRVIHAGGHQQACHQRVDQQVAELVPLLQSPGANTTDQLALPGPPCRWSGWDVQPPPVCQHARLP